VVTRLIGGNTPGDGADPRTFPTVYDELVDEVENKANIDHEHQEEDVNLKDYIETPSTVENDYYLTRQSGGASEWVRPPYVINEHGSNASAPRIDADVNEWRGTVEPSNAINGDKYIPDWS
jgi:hypothetical protein